MKRSTHPGVLAIALTAASAISCTHTPVVRTAVPPTTSLPTIWDRQVRNAVDAGDGDYRLRALREKVAAEPENVTARAELAAAYRERGYPEIALEISRLAVARFPESGEAQLSLVRDLRATNHRAEAIACLEAFLKSHGDSGAAYWSWLGILRDESGLWPLGEPAHRKAIERSPNADDLHNNLGYNLLMQKKYQDAVEEFRAALQLKPENAVARNNLATALANSNATAEAMAAWQSVTDPASAHNNLATVWMEKGNYQAARKELELALGYNGSHPAARKNLELLARLDGRPAGAAAGRPRNSRFTAGLKRLFVGPLDSSKQDTGKVAAAR